MSIILLSLFLYYLIHLTVGYYRKRREERLNDELNGICRKPKHPLHVTEYEAQLPQKPSQIGTALRYIGSVNNLIDAERGEGNIVVCHRKEYVYTKDRWVEIGSFSVW